MDNSKNIKENLIGIGNQYLKDLSFENPQTPGIFKTKSFKPEMDISVDIKANLIEEKNYEIVLFIKVVYQIENKVIFVIDFFTY